MCCIYLHVFITVTPHDYQPPGFKEGENSMLVFQKEPVNLTMGEVVTPFHTLNVDVTTERERLEQVLFILYSSVQGNIVFNIVLKIVCLCMFAGR